MGRRYSHKTKRSNRKIDRASARPSEYWLCLYLPDGEGRGLNHETLEEVLSERGREVQRLLYQAQVDSRAPGPAAEPVCGADRMLRKVQRLHGRRLSNVFGEVRSRRVAGGMRRSATLRNLSEKQRELVEAAANYLLNHTNHLRYHDYLATGFSIATGVIEGARRRHLVCDRMDGAARWSLAGAEGVLCLRALRSSGDLDGYWRFHVTQKYQGNHVAGYANGDFVPRKGHSHIELRVVK